MLDGFVRLERESLAPPKDPDKEDIFTQWPLEGKALFKNLISRILDENRKRVITDIFQTGKAIGWLMCELISPHIQNGNISSMEIFFSQNEIVEISKILNERFKSSDLERIINTPHPLRLLYGWLKSGYNEDVSKWVMKQVKTD